MAGDLVRFLELAFIKLVLPQRPPEFFQGSGPPVARAFQENAQDIHLVGVFLHEPGEGFEVALGVVVFAQAINLLVENRSCTS